MTSDGQATIESGLRQYLGWALRTLGLTDAEISQTDMRFSVPVEHRAYFQGATHVQLVDGPTANRTSHTTASSVSDAKQTVAVDATQVPVDYKLVAWLLAQLNAAPVVPAAIPTLPALRVHDISSRLFEAYSVQGGKVHLSGCTLEERPVLRQTWLESDAASAPRLAHRYTGSVGGRLSDAEVDALGLAELQIASGSLPRISRDDVRAWCEVSAEGQNDDPLPPAYEVVASVVWCQYAAGKIEFVIGDQSAEVAFSGWARQLVAGLIEPPEFVCPVTGVASRQLAAAEDGQITALEAIQTCAASGRRVLVSELEKCDQTGEMVMSEFLVTCPVSGQRILESSLESCSTCRQAVSPACCLDGVCEVCRTMVAIRKDDPRMARVLGEYPRLDRWRRWRIGETSTCYVLIAVAFFKRMLIVVDKENLEVLRLATRNRFSSFWADPPVTDQQDLLR